MPHPTTPFTKFFGTEKSLLVEYKNNSHPAWKNIVTLLNSIMTFLSRRRWLLSHIVKHIVSFISVMLDTPLPARNKVSHREWQHSSLSNQRSLIQLSQLDSWCSHSSKTAKTQSWNITTVKHIVISLKTTLNLQSDQNIVVSSVLVCYYNIIKCSLIHDVQRLNKLWICLWRVFHILHIRSISHHMNIMCLDSSERC